MWLAAHSAMPHIMGWRVMRRMPRAGSSVLRRRSWPTSVGLRVMRLAAIRTIATGITISGA